MIEKVNKVRNGINKALYCDSTLEGCSDCPYTMDCVPTEMISVPRNMLLDAGQVLSNYWETFQPGYKTNTEKELESIVEDFKARMNRFAYKTFVSVGVKKHVECSVCGYNGSEISNTSVLWCPHCGARFV